MKQIVNTRNGGTQVLKVTEGKKPAPAANEVLISVKAAGLNFSDIMARQGLYPDAPKKPCVLGYEVSGIVEAAGANVDKSFVGKDVVALTIYGGQSEEVVTPRELVFEKPRSLSFEQAAAIPVNYVTAYGMMVGMGSLSKGETVLIHNAGGGVGLAALDIAKHLGAKTIGTASESKQLFLKERGLDHAIDYRRRDWFLALMELTDSKGVDLILDPIGGENWKKDYKALRASGRMGVFGLSAVAGSQSTGALKYIVSRLTAPRFEPWSLFNQNKGVFGFNLAHLVRERVKVVEWMHAILAGVNEGWVKPYVGKVFSFNEVASAHIYMESRSNVGKIILVP